MLLKSGVKMDDFKINIENLSGIKPGKILFGNITGISNKVIDGMILRLFWFTQGKGTKDTKTVSEFEFSCGKNEFREDFSIQLPFTPCSFTGKLISLNWALELIIKPTNKSSLYEFILSENGEIRDLYHEEF